MAGLSVVIPTLDEAGRLPLLLAICADGRDISRSLSSTVAVGTEQL